MSERVKLKENVWRDYSGPDIGPNCDDDMSGRPSSHHQPLPELWSGLKRYKRADPSKFGYRAWDSDAINRRRNVTDTGQHRSVSAYADALSTRLPIGVGSVVISPDGSRVGEHARGRLLKRPGYSPIARRFDEDDESWAVVSPLHGPVRPLADAYPLGTRIVAFSRYAQAHAQPLVSGPDDFIPLDWHREHTMRDALPLYVANKVPGAALQQAIDLGCKVEVHGTYPEEFPNVASVLGFRDVTRIPFRIHPEQKRHNYVRPQYFWARKLGKPVLVAAVTPGKDYVYHYAEMIRYELASRGADTERALSVTRYPVVERNIAHWTGLNEKIVKRGDRVIFGNFASAVESDQYASLGAEARRLESDISRSPASSSTCSCWR